MTLTETLHSIAMAPDTARLGDLMDAMTALSGALGWAAGWSGLKQGDRMMKKSRTYVVTTESGIEWLIESAASADEAVRIYCDGEAEPHRSVRQLDRRFRSDKDTAEYLTSMGQTQN